MIVYIEISIGYKCKLLELSKDFNKVPRLLVSKIISFQINIKKSSEFLYARKRYLEYITFKNTT